MNHSMSKDNEHVQVDKLPGSNENDFTKLLLAGLILNGFYSAAPDELLVRDPDLRNRPAEHAMALAQFLVKKNEEMG